VLSNQNPPSPASPVDDEVLAERIRPILASVGPGGASVVDLAHRLAVAPAQLEGGLRYLEAEGTALARGANWTLVRFTELVVGAVEVLERGGALLRAGFSGEPTHQIAPRDLSGARGGDLVVARPLQRRTRRASPGLPPAGVVKVLSVRHPQVVGRLARDVAGGLVLEPFDPKFSVPIELERPARAREGDWVVVRLEASRVPGVARGAVQEILGDVERPGVDVAVVVRHYAIPDGLDPRALAEASRLPEDPAPEDWQDRLDLRPLTTVTIDGESARDFDDALSVAALDGGGWELGVHIADVSHYVQEGTALDWDAFVRGTSVYFPERALPMLPERLSNGLCSLRPGVPRLAMSVFLRLDAHGEIVGRRFAESVIASDRRLTYAEVRRLLEQPDPRDASDYPSAVLALLAELERLMRALNARRLSRGSLDFDLPEGDVVLSTDGATVGILPSERTVAHRIVEECMIAANQAVAAELWQADCPALYRVHDAPEPRRCEELRTVFASLGFEAPPVAAMRDPSSLQAALAKAAGRPEEAFLAALVLRAMSRASYDPDCRGHYALAARFYTHFTSPIRRYPDLLVHRRLRAHLRGVAAAEAQRSRLGERLPAVARHASATERRAEAAERELLQWKKVRFLAARIGEEFAGHISGVAPFGLFVQLAGLWVDGLVAIRTMTDDFYVFDNASHTLAGANAGRRFRLGDAVRVALIGVDERNRGLKLQITGMPAKQPVRARRRT
jgi:ribonuclease R